ncbi:MAG: MFS transporter [Candidatus Omnitrophota bacterium]
MKLPQAPSKGTSVFRNVFRALRHRNYRIFFWGQSASLIGTWMQQVALSWLVYRMTNSPFLLGMTGFLSQVPTFFFTLFAGVLADRHSRRNMLYATQILSLVQASILAFLVLTDQIQVWHIMALSFFLGTIFSFDIPIRQAFTVEMIEDREDLGNAIALNSSMLNAARLIGPSIAGILIASVGEGVCFLLNAVSYIPVLLSLKAMRLGPPKLTVPVRHIFVELREGLGYAFRFAPIKWILILLSMISLMGVPYQVLMPVFARDIFQGGSNTLGFLLGMSGLGALIGAVYLASRKSVIGLVRIIAWTAVLFGVTIIVFSFSRTFWFAMPVILMSGFGVMVNMAACNTILQTVVDEDKRGRVMALYTMAFMGTMPFGSLLAGVLATRIGAPHTLLIGGACCVVMAFVFMRKMPLIRKEIRPVYARKGIVPEVARGIQAATEIEGFAKE